MLAYAPEAEETCMAKVQGEKVHCVVQPHAQQSGHNSPGDIEPVMVAERQARLVKVTGRIGTVLEMSDHREVFVKVGFVMKIEQNRRKRDRYRRERRYPPSLRPS
jgi:hypothetical protein